MKYLQGKIQNAFKSQVFLMLSLAKAEETKVETAEAD